MKADLDLLIHRHFEGTLSEAESSELAARLQGDPGARRRMAEMAFDATSLRDVLARARAGRRRRRLYLPLAAAAAVFVLVTGVVLFAPGPEAPPPPPSAAPAAAPKPAEAPPRGFAGTVTGSIASHAEGSFRLRAVAPPSLAGRTLSVAPGFSPGDAGSLVTNKVHTAWIRRLTDGQDVTVDLRQVGDDVFVIGELTKEQTDWAVRRGDARKPKPEREGDRKDGDKEK